MLKPPDVFVSPKWFFQFLDTLCLLVAFGVAYLLLPYFGPRLNPAFSVLHENSSGVLVILALPMWLLLLDGGGMYADPVRISYGEIVLGMLRVSLVGLGLLSLVVFAAKEQGVSRLLVFSFGALSFTILTAARFIGKQYYGHRQRAGYYLRRALVIASPANAQAMEQFVQKHGLAQQLELRLWSLPQDPSGQVAPVWNQALLEALARKPIDEIIIVSNAQTEPLIDSAAMMCSMFSQPLRIISEEVLRYRAWTTPSLAPYPDSFFGIPSLLLLRAERRPAYEFAKRVIDLVVSGVLLVILAPLLAVLALMVKLSSPGPIFYRWRVLGQNNREFTGYKFRTMVANADQLKATLLTHNEMTGPVFKMKHDPRITRVGRVLRKFSLDELPQLWSVLKGDMSLVGPRPPLRSEFERFEFWQARKLRVKPGITCLWQVSGRNEIKDFDEWVRLDLQYIDRRSLRLDLEILAKTAWAVLAGTGH